MAGALPIRAKARIRLSIGERFRTNSCEFGSLGEAGCLPIHDAAGSKMPTGCDLSPENRAIGTGVFHL